MTLTLDVDEIVNGLFETELVDEEGFLFFGNAIEEVFEVSVPDLCYLGKETLSDGLIAHVYEDLTKEEVVLCHVRMLRTPFCGLQVYLTLGRRYCIFELAHCLAIVILEFIEFGESAM